MDLRKFRKPNEDPFSVSGDFQPKAFDYSVPPSTVLPSGATGSSALHDVYKIPNLPLVRAHPRPTGLQEFPLDVNSGLWPTYQEVWQYMTLPFAVTLALQNISPFGSNLAYCPETFSVPKLNWNPDRKKEVPEMSSTYSRQYEPTLSVVAEQNISAEKITNSEDMWTYKTSLPPKKKIRESKTNKKGPTETKTNTVAELLDKHKRMHEAANKLALEKYSVSLHNTATTPSSTSREPCIIDRTRPPQEPKYSIEPIYSKKHKKFDKNLPCRDFNTKHKIEACKKRKFQEEIIPPQEKIAPSKKMKIFLKEAEAKLFTPKLISVPNKESSNTLTLHAVNEEVTTPYVESTEDNKSTKSNLQMEYIEELEKMECIDGLSTLGYTNESQNLKYVKEYPQNSYIRELVKVDNTKSVLKDDPRDVQENIINISSKENRNSKETKLPEIARIVFPIYKNFKASKKPRVKLQCSILEDSTANSPTWITREKNRPLEEQQTESQVLPYEVPNIVDETQNHEEVLVLEKVVTSTTEKLKTLEIASKGDIVQNYEAPTGKSNAADLWLKIASQESNTPKYDKPLELTTSSRKTPPLPAGGSVHPWNAGTSGLPTPSTSQIELLRRLSRDRIRKAYNLHETLIAKLGGANTMPERKLELDLFRRDLILELIRKQFGVENEDELKDSIMCYLGDQQQAKTYVEIIENVAKGNIM